MACPRGSHWRSSNACSTDGGTATIWRCGRWSANRRRGTGRLKPRGLVRGRGERRSHDVPRRRGGHRHPRGHGFEAGAPGAGPRRRPDAGRHPRAGNRRRARIGPLEPGRHHHRCHARPRQGDRPDRGGDPSQLAPAVDDSKRSPGVAAADGAGGRGLCPDEYHATDRDADPRHSGARADTTHTGARGAAADRARHHPVGFGVADRHQLEPPHRRHRRRPWDRDGDALVRPRGASHRARRFPGHLPLGATPPAREGCVHATRARLARGDPRDCARAHQRAPGFDRGRGANPAVRAGRHPPLGRSGRPRQRDRGR